VYMHMKLLVCMDRYIDVCVSAANITFAITCTLLRFAS
jgi:hypothetical protein